MNQITNKRSQLVEIARRSFCLLILSLFWMVVGAMAQTATGGSTPSGLKPGAPAGSYALSGFENVNLFNGNVNFNLPLLKIGGRGGSGMTVTASLNSIKWTVQNFTIEGTEGSTSCGNPDGDPDIQGCHYLPMTAPSGGNPQPQAYPEPEWWGGLRVGYGPGVLQGRRTANDLGPVTKMLIRLTFTAPGGTEYELRDLATNGRPYGGAGYGWTPPSNHGLVYSSEDGAVTFTADEQIVYVFGRGTGLVPQSRMTGYLDTADGMHYRIENGLVMWTRDRNGNKSTFTYYTTGAPRLWRVSTITDSLGRVTNFYYADTVTPYDRIVFPAFGGTTTQEIKVYRKHLSQALRTTRTGDSTTTKTFGQLFPELLEQDTVGGTTYDPDDVITEIKLPDDRSYKLYYNVYNELARVELPTGGAIEYDYTLTGSSVIWGIYSGPQIHRRVTERRIYADGASNAFESRQTYTPTFTATAYSGSTPTFWETTVEVKQYGASNLMSSEKHTFFWSPVASLSKAPVSYSGWKEGKEKKTEFLNAQGTALQRVENTWEQCAQCELDMSWWTPTSVETSDHAPSNNPHITATVTTLLDVSPNLVSKQTFHYDKYSNLTDSYDYDFNPSEAAAYPVRHTKTDYLTSNDYTATNVHLRSLPTMQRVYAVNPSNGAETLAAKSETVYDESTYQVAESYSGLTAWTDPGAARGNATTSRRWHDVSSSSSYIETHAQYDQLGNVRKTWDGRSKISQFEYSSTYKYALPTHTKSPKPDPEGTTGSSSELETTSVYDFSTGLVTSTTDANGQLTEIEYNDDLNRPTKITRPTGGGWTSFEYGDSIGTLFVRTQTTLDATRTIEEFQYFDGLGRAWRSSQTEGATSIIADTQYDALGRVWKVSNPYRTGDSFQWTTTSYDAFGRTTNVKTPDNAEVVTAYSGNTVTVTDQAGKQRKSATDALGRVTKVYEAPNDTTNFNFQTNYVYDVLGNLRTVTQGSQKRYFLYDSLSRLIRARHPELDIHSSLNVSSDVLTENNTQWSLAYSYDNNGNLLTRTDARGTTTATGTTTAYIYDSLNRVTQRSYSGGTAVATPTVTYTYDGNGVTNSKGRLTSVSSSVSAYDYTAYDALGRITGSQQVTDGRSYSMSYEYDLAGNMTSQTYPTGRVVTQSFDNSGRLASINGHVSGSAAKTYANLFGYTAHGSVERMRLGNGRWEHTNFNNRLQPIEIGLGSSATDSSVLKLNYEYGTTQNNGNVHRQLITVPTIGENLGFTATQHYLYDEMNRLAGAQEVNGDTTAWQSTVPSSPFWQQRFNYDRFGNRDVDTENTTSTLVGPNPVIGTTNNRIVGQPGEYYEYDAAGNLTIGQSGDTFGYDAENKLVQYEGGASQIVGADYFYDGDGKRVKKATTAETITFVYNIGGQLVAEYTSSTPESNGTIYLTCDTLGTPRVNTKNNGNVSARHDYLPFGEELFSGMGGRTADQEYVVDNIHQKFTQKERDSETGLDFFDARYYSSMQGRFTSPDPLLSSGRSSNPQTWNRYSYTLGNPLKFVDPTGLFEWDATLRDDPNFSDKERKRRGKLRDAFTNARKEAQDAANSGKLSADKLKKTNDALNAYGAENEKNGVTVGVGTAKGEAGSTLPTFAINEKWNGVSATIEVKFDEKFLLSDKAVLGVAHEGAHVQDAFTFANAYPSFNGLSVDARLADPRDARQWDTENNAFHVQSYLSEAMGKNDDKWGTWKTSWANLDAQQQQVKRQDAVTKIIKDVYGWTQDNKGWNMGSRACRPC